MEDTEKEKWAFLSRQETRGLQLKDAVDVDGAVIEEIVIE